MKKPSGKRAPRVPFVVTVTLTVAAASAAGACGGDAFRDGTGTGGSAAGGSGGNVSTGGTVSTGGFGGTGGFAGSGTGGVGGTGGSGVCPTTMSGAGASCATGTVCTYPNGPCCPASEARCVDGQWQILSSSCNPPPPMACPAVPPVAGSDCGPVDPCGASQYLDCTWGTCPNGLSQTTARCDGNVWQVSYQCGAADAGTDCSAYVNTLVDYANANKACVTAADCTKVSAHCADAADYCDGTFYVNQAIDMTTWSSLANSLASCYYQQGIGCAVCDAIAPPPACINGQCQGSWGF